MYPTFVHSFKFLMAKCGGKKEIVVFNSWPQIILYTKAFSYWKVLYTTLVMKYEALKSWAEKDRETKR